jgi:hypothetical protein
VFEATHPHSEAGVLLPKVRRWQEKKDYHRQTGIFPGRLNETFAACEEYIIREMGAIFDKYMARMDAREAEKRNDDALLMRSASKK